MNTLHTVAPPPSPMYAQVSRVGSGVVLFISLTTTIATGTVEVPLTLEEADAPKAALPTVKLVVVTVAEPVDAVYAGGDTVVAPIYAPLDACIKL